MQDRTHKGGAVLWFLRKHAPMPLPYADFIDPDDSPRASPVKVTEKQAAGEVPVSASSKPKPKPKDIKSQRKFLHGTLKVIGTELDNQHDIDQALTLSATPQGCRLGGDASLAAWSTRDALRKTYAAHTVSELEQLEADVEAKEKEVAALKKQVDQMTRFLAATRAAAQSRRMREQEPERAQPMPMNVPTNLVGVLAKTKKTFMTNAGAAMWETDREVGGGTNVIEEWQNTILQQSEMAQRMRAHVDEQKRALEQQTSHRKAQETALFSSQVSSLKMRAEAQSAEARVQRLAEELKRVYQTMPESVVKKVQRDIDAVRTEHEVTEVEHLRLEHNIQFFKFMDCPRIHHETEVCQQKISECQEDVNNAHKVLEKGRWFTDSCMQHTKAAKVALDALHDRWARFVAAGYPAGELTVRDDTGARSEDADCILHRATLSVTALSSLIDTLHTGSGSTGAKTHEKQKRGFASNNANRAASDDGTRTADSPLHESPSRPTSPASPAAPAEQVGEDPGSPGPGSPLCRTP